MNLSMPSKSLWFHCMVHSLTNKTVQCGQLVFVCFSLIYKAYAVLFFWKTSWKINGSTWPFVSVTAIYFKYVYAFFGFGNATVWEDMDS